MNPYKSLRLFCQRAVLLISILVSAGPLSFAQNAGWKDFIGHWKISSGTGNEAINIKADEDPSKQISFDFSELNLKNWAPDSHDLSAGRFVFKMTPRLDQMKKEIPAEINSSALGAGLSWYLEINLQRDGNDSTKNLLKITFYKGRIYWIKKDPPEFKSISNYPANDAREGPYKTDITASMLPKTKCNASKTTTEEKVQFTLLSETIEKVTDIINTPGSPVELKIAIDPTLSVKQGEECCSENKPPVVYTEWKGAVEGSGEINFRLLGIPDLKTSFDLWVFKVEAKLVAKIFIGGQGKISVGAVGKFYNGYTGSAYNPDCPQPCRYLTLRWESYLRAGAKVQAKFSINEPESVIEDGKLVNDVVKAEASAEVTASVGFDLKGTYGLDNNCVKPGPGFHGSIFLGKLKGNAKFKVQLGPIKFDFNYESIWFDGFEIPLPFH